MKSKTGETPISNHHPFIWSLFGHRGDDDGEDGPLLEQEEEEEEGEEGEEES
ncbi:hypothetical protein GE21DRAFT_1290495 [Neurospora crassa]|nr:hypothetical protein GE21DRAFT_1290495 [Neurospora crassa]